MSVERKCAGLRRRACYADGTMSARTVYGESAGVPVMAVISSMVDDERERCAKLVDALADNWLAISKAQELGKTRNLVAAQRCYVREEELRKAAKAIRNSKP